MKHTLWILISLTVIFTLAACSTSTAPETASDGYVSQNLDVSYEGALPVRNQLALGTLQLEGTANAVTADQAALLIPLWQALKSTSKTGGSSEAEMNALLGQIEGALTAEQLSAIQALQLTQTDLQTWAQASGITMGTGSGQPGAGRNLSEDERATKRAAEGGTGGSGGGASTAILDAVITYLEGLN